jgi:hypothetical protein
MEPQANSAPSPESLPPVTPESGSLEPVEAPASQEVSKPKESANQNAGVITPVAPATPVISQPVVTDDDQTVQTTPVQSDTPSIADDVDVIEKEWVDKAKSIVDKTKDDPHVQNKEVSILKADYMKKRYGKDIKLTEN